MWPGLCLGIATLIFSAQAIADKPLRIAAASSLVPLITQSASRNIQITAAASGVLHAQISQGASYDILLTADPKYADALQQSGLSSPHQRHCLALSGLVLATATGPAPDLQLLKGPSQPNVRLVIADPALAPFGAAALQVLDYAGGTEQWGSSLIRARSAAQATQILVSGNAAVALLPPSLAITHQLPHTAIPSEWFQPVRYEAVILSAHPAAMQFIDNLRSEILKTPGTGPCSNA